jgi:HD-GYP domain-containing protein (c-di-GMP phosphodiesterase class II)
VYDAITLARPYKPAATPAQAFEELMTEAKRGWHVAISSKRSLR